MQLSYIYSASRVNALSTALPKKSDYERLITATSEAEMLSVLRDTFAVSVIEQMPAGSLDEVLEATLLQVKQTLLQIAPKADPLRFLWVQYDIHNLRLFAKAKRGAHGWSDVQVYVSHRGLYDPSYLYEHAENSTLNRLVAGWQETYEQMVSYIEQREIRKADAVADALYFTMMKDELLKTNDNSIRAYVERSIDMYNIKARLRALQTPTGVSGNSWISGGAVSLSAIETKEMILQVLQTMSHDDWRGAIEYMETTGNSSRLDARVDEYIASVARHASYSGFQASSLLFYYLLCRQAAVNIRIIAAAKKSGMSQQDVRINLRMTYVND